MSADRLLNTVLAYYQDVHDGARTDQIFGSTVHLLTQLSHPLNLGVLTSQFLTAPAIWHPPGGVRTSMRIMSVYNTAAMRVREYEADYATRKGPYEGGGLRSDEWVRAVVKGADDRSPRWKHLLVLTGALIGLEGNNRRSLSRGLRNTLEGAVIMAANMALEGQLEHGPVASASIVVALNFALPLLSEYHQRQLNCNLLLPLAVWAITGEEGFWDGQFLEAVGQDVSETPNHKLKWGAEAPSFHLLEEIDKRPLMANIGPLSKLAAFAVEYATDTGIVLQAQDALLEFSQRVLNAWQKNRLNDVDPNLESTALAYETQRIPWPALWALLRKLLFGTVAVLQAIVSRSLLDPLMLSDAVAPGIAAKTLLVLRNVYFISSRNGNSAFQVYTFTYMTSIDSLCRSPSACERFLREARMVDGPVASTHLHRTLDLYYLNLSEHLPLNLSTDACDALIIKPAIAYLSHDGPLTPSMTQLFESAHSAVLAVLASPQHSTLTLQMAPFYIVKLFESFPQHISSRQFRVAFKTVMQICSPPFPIANMEPRLAETLLEMLRSAIEIAPSEPLPPTPEAVALEGATEEPPEPFSAQSSLALALVDSLPSLPQAFLEDWLTITAQLLYTIEDPRLREPVKKRFVDVLGNGELDVERAAIAVAWWGTQGGRQLVLFGGVGEAAVMSGAIVTPDRSSRL